ncbi:MAG: DUF4926 domain-containing protein [bacterium]
MKLPNHENAVIPQTKITGYLLSQFHRDGRGKARFFTQFGFSADLWEELAQALRRHAVDNEVVKTEASPFGTRYVIEGTIRTPDGRMPLVKEATMIHELDNVVLTVDLPERGLREGDIGTVVLVHRSGEGFEVEFIALDGETVAVVSVFASQIRPIGQREIAHARKVEAVW